MDLFNRWLVTLLALAAAAGSGMVLAAAAGWLTAVTLPGYPAITTWADALHETASPLLVAGSVAGVVIALALAFIEWIVPARGQRVVIARDKLGSVTVSLPGLRRLANHVIAELNGVETVISDARPTREGMAFDCRIVVKPDANTPELAQTIRERLDDAVRSHTGRPVTRIHVHAQVGSGGFRKRVR